MNYQLQQFIMYSTCIFILCIIMLSCDPSKKVGPSDHATNMIITSSGLKYQVIKKGDGNPAKVGQEVLIHEKMSYPNDSLLFSSYDLQRPVKVLIGANQAIKGVDEGLRGIKKGEIRKLTVPPALSKRTGVQTFPHPDSTLVYEIELIEILTGR